MPLEGTQTRCEDNNTDCGMGCDSRETASQEQIKMAREELTTKFHKLEDDQIQLVRAGGACEIGAPSRAPKGCAFDSQAGHRLQGEFPVVV